MTQTTSGIEPAFLVAYKRRRKINPNDKDVRIDFVDDNGDSWEEYTVFHHKFIDWLIANEYDVDTVKEFNADDLAKVVAKSPYYKATSNDVNWLEKVNMQGQVQKWIDHSISVTVNLPKETTEEIVSQVYLEAWKSGCKGITVYRDGSRSGVLVSNNKEEKSVDELIRESNAPKRPKILECDILRFQNNKEKWIGFVGLINGQPYEIFTGKLDSFQVPTFVESGWIKKNKETKKDDDGKEYKSSRYDFVYVDKDGYEQEMRGLSRAFDREYWNYGKMCSAILRHGMPIPSTINLIDSLYLNGDSVVSWKSGIKRMLKKYIIDGENVQGQKCPECGNTELKFESGCVQCPKCGWSKCS
jgi:ribonucleoside-diphosphate reductase alpha chain